MVQAARYGTRLNFKSYPYHNQRCAHKSCGVMFSAVRRDAMYCSTECRVQAHRERKRSPEYLLRNRPYDLSRYQQLKDDFSESAADTVAKCFAAFGVDWGLEVLTACILATGRAAAINDVARQYMLQAHSNTYCLVENAEDGK